MKKILIIGGMGPQASLNLHHRIIDEQQRIGVKSGTSFPLIFHISVPVPEFIISDIGKLEALNMLSECLEQLKEQDFTHALIACNTAHLLINDLRSLLPKAKFISLIDIASKYVLGLGIDRIGILATPNTINSKLHINLFNKLDVITLGIRSQKKTSMIINKLIVEDHPPTKELKRQLIKLKNLGAEKVLLGCTELSTINYKAKFDNVIDPFELAVEEIYKQ